MSLSLDANESDARSGRWTTDPDADRTPTNSSPVFMSSGWKSLDRYRNVADGDRGSSLLEQIAEQRQKLRGGSFNNSNDLNNNAGELGTAGGRGGRMDPSGYETAVTAL